MAELAHTATHGVVLPEQPATGGRALRYEDGDEAAALAALARRTDFDALRLKRLLALPDLTRKAGSPVKFIIEKILTVPVLKGFDVMEIPQTITPANNFDLYDFPPDHPARRETDTYFITPQRLLRTHTTSMWYYYLRDPQNVELLEERGWVGLLAYGKVYRKDEIDRKHFPVFHQIDGLYVTKRSVKTLVLQDLHDALTAIARGVFGADAVTRFLDDDFPYTSPSTQMEVKFGDDWLEILGAGIAKGSTLQKLGIDPAVYNGWAFGFGVERWAMKKMAIPDIRILWANDERITKQFTSIDSVYQEVSKYPSVIRDISFIVDKTMSVNRFYEIVRELGQDLVEQVELTDQYENDAKLGAGKKSYTFRIVYRSLQRTLTNDEVNVIHKKIEDMTRGTLAAVIR